MTRFLPLFAVVIAGSACAVPTYDEIANVPVQSAELDVTIFSVGMMGGGGGGTGSLEVLDVDGALHQFDVALASGWMGMPMEMGAATMFDDVPVSVADGAVINDLFEVYKCSTVTLMMGAGVNRRDCKAEKASFEATGLAVGMMSILGASEYLAISWDDAGSTPGPNP